MTIDLSSVHAKIRRAQEHHYILQEGVRAWFHHRHYEIVQKTNADCSEHSLLIRKTDTCEPPLETWALIFGDAMHNLRSALDHLIFAIAMHHGAITNQRVINFPLAAIPDKIPGDATTKGIPSFVDLKAKVSGGCNINSAVWASIERVQPYNRRQPLLPPLLSLLGEFDNLDKHRLIHGFLATPSEIRATFDGMLPMGVAVIEQRPFFGEIKDDTEIVRIVLSGPAPNMKYRNMDVELVFAVPHEKRFPHDPGWMGRTEAGGLLRDIEAEVIAVKDIVVAAVQ